MVSVIAPVGDIAEAAGGGPTALTEKFNPELQGPYPELFQVCIHQIPLPLANAIAGVTEQVPVPLAQPT